MSFTWPRALAVSVVLSCGAITSGCIPGPLVSMTSQTRQNLTQDKLVLAKRPANYVDTASQVGLDLGYKLAGVNRTENSVRFTAGKGIVSNLLLGKNESVQLETALQPDGRTVALQILVVGNFSAAKQETVERRLAEFKQALQARLER